MAAPFVVVSDFDGTITNEDLVVALTTEVNPENRTVIERIQRRDVDLKTGLDLLFGTLKSANKPAYEAYLRETATFRNGFHRFRRLLFESQIPFYIVSNGLDFMLNTVLGDAAHDHHRMVNQARFDEERIRITWHYPCQPPCPGGCGLCKYAVVNELRERHNAPIAFIGDGVTDYNGALQADRVFARSRLADYLTQAGKPLTPFESFDDVIAELFVLAEGGAS